MRTNSLLTAPSDSSRYCGFRPSVTSSPTRFASTDSDGARLLGARCIHRHAVGREREPQRRGAVEHERHTTHRFGELGGVDDRVVLGLLGEQTPDRREVALDEQRGHGLVARREGDDLAVPGAGERDARCRRRARRSCRPRAACGRERAPSSAHRTRRRRRPTGSRGARRGSGRWRPGSAVVPETSSCTPVSTGVTSSREAAKATWAIAVAKSSAGTRPGVAGHLGNRRILLHRHDGEREACRTAASARSRRRRRPRPGSARSAAGWRSRTAGDRGRGSCPGSSTVASIVVRADAS